MSFARIYSAQVVPLDAHIIDVEVDLSRGLHAFSIVGLPDKAVEEARDRISAAIKNSGFTSPKQKNQKIVISLAPAELKKEGSAFDVAMAVGYLLAAGDISFKPAKKIFLGELSLKGDVRPVRGTLLMVQKAAQAGFTEIFVPRENALEAALVRGVSIYPLENLRALVEHLNTKNNTRASISPQPETVLAQVLPPHALVDLGDIKGQENAKRGLAIAAAGGHNLALFGPPGTGKTLLARALAGILPPLTFEETLEVTGIHSVAEPRGELLTHPPFRAPHHTASYVAVVGGGAHPRPGEVTLAHRGVLFLDEFPEFDRRVIESLREPLEERYVSISRARGSARFPAHFILIAALNPCPCGNWGNPKKSCRCSPSELARYKRKLSGPLVDRIDMWIEVGSIDYETLTLRSSSPISEAVRGEIMSARERQRVRYKETSHLTLNSSLRVSDLERYISLPKSVQTILRSAMELLKLSPRSYHRTIKLARTIADLEGTEEIADRHMLEAIQYRPKGNLFPG